MDARLIRLGFVGLRNLLLGANLASLTLLANPKQLVAYATENLVYFQKVTGARRLKVANVFSALGPIDSQAVRLGNLSGSTWFWPNASFAVDIVSLSLICQIIRPKLIFEIGTFKGYTALHLALNSPPDTEVYTLDLPADRDVTPSLSTTSIDIDHIARKTPDHLAFDATDVAPMIRRVYGDSAIYDFTPFHGRVDVFFIDGAHSYEYVRSDTKNAFKCCHAGSVIAWHDYGRMGVNGVSKLLHELVDLGHTIYCVPGGSLAYMRVSWIQYH